MAKTFDCPSCGAPLEIEGDPETMPGTIQCKYCNETVIVPEELRARPKSNPPPGEPVSFSPPPVIYSSSEKKNLSPQLAVYLIGFVLLLIAVIVNFPGIRKQNSAQNAYSDSPFLTIYPTLYTTPIPMSAFLPPSFKTETALAKITPEKIIITPAVIKMQISPKDGMELVYVPAGEFQMGSDKSMDGIEAPVHPVTLDSYWIDQTDVTNAMYEKCVSAAECKAPSDTKSATRSAYYGDNQYADYPVVHVDWNQAAAYCKWAGRDLPTEAQWEKAARGTDGRAYPWGNDGVNQTNKASYDHNVDTTRVGSFPAGASPYGALDMAGNVRQWVADWYGPYPGSAQTDPRGPAAGSGRVLRGGSWSDGVYLNRSTNRSYYKPSTESDSFGFRCAASP